MQKSLFDEVTFYLLIKQMEWLHITYNVLFIIAMTLLSPLDCMYLEDRGIVFVIFLSTAPDT
jgi:hypothetical protein